METPGFHPENEDATAEWISVEARGAVAEIVKCRLVRSDRISRSPLGPFQDFDVLMLTRDGATEVTINPGEKV